MKVLKTNNYNVDSLIYINHKSLRIALSSNVDTKIQIFDYKKKHA